MLRLRPFAVRKTQAKCLERAYIGTNISDVDVRDERLQQVMLRTPAVKAAVVLPMGCQAAICLG